MSAAGPPSAESGFVVCVPEAEDVVRALRQRYHAVALLGVPAHITVLYPFMPPQHITHEVLARAAAAVASVPAFAFAMGKVGRFPATAYLAPDPAEPFVALTEALARAFPAYPPFRGEHATIVPHLTVAHGSADDAQHAAVELEAAMRLHGPVRAWCSQVSLLGSAAGRWREMHRLPLSSHPGA